MNLRKEGNVRKLSSTLSIPDLTTTCDINSLLEGLTTGEHEQNCEFLVENKTIWVKGKLIYINEEVRYLVTFADVTLQKECEMLKDINKMKSKIICSLSHEIRNPLHNILDSLSNCLKNPTEIHQSIKIANSNSNIILYKINDLLVISYTGLFAIRNRRY
jgi:signal transduction histidine kinase